MCGPASTVSITAMRDEQVVSAAPGWYPPPPSVSAKREPSGRQKVLVGFALVSVTMMVLVMILSSGGGKATPKTPAQTFIDEFNSISMTPAKSSTDKQFLIRAGRGVCHVVKSGGTEAQAENDMSVIGVTDHGLAKLIVLAAESPGSLCPV